ncbi:MAG: Fic family protein [Planctomycetaceae bacterium]|jgi:Fic family protein
MPLDSSPLALLLEGSPYSLSPSGLTAAWQAVCTVSDELDVLRAQGRLSAEVVTQYYGRTIFEQVAESNALEGSTLSIGETEAAVLKGITLTGHDPGYVRDAQSLYAAMQRLAELARTGAPTDLETLKELHELILEGRRLAGEFRRNPVAIRGSDHRPPKTRAEIMDQMEHWEAWSQSRADAPAILRAVVLHAWLTHIHPFGDGNGRTARAISTLELLRGGSPPVIIKKVKHRNQYLDSLAASDAGGDLGPFLEFLLRRHHESVRTLLHMSTEAAGLTVPQAKLLQAQQKRVDLWNRAVELLAVGLEDRLTSLVGPLGGAVRFKVFPEGLDRDDFTELWARRAISQSWAFRATVVIPGLPTVERLAWIGFRSEVMEQTTQERGPSLFWSRRNPELSYPPWSAVTGADAPRYDEFTCDLTAVGDRWFALSPQGAVKLTTSELADQLAQGFAALAQEG